MLGRLISLRDAFNDWIADRIRLAPGSKQYRILVRILQPINEVEGYWHIFSGIVTATTAILTNEGWVLLLLLLSPVSDILLGITSYLTSLVLHIDKKERGKQ